MELKQKIFLFFLIFPFIKPASIANIPAISFIDGIYDIWRIASAAVIFFMYVRRGKLSPVMGAVILYFASMLFSTVIHNADLVKFTSSCITVVGFCMLTELEILSSPRVFFRELYVIYSLLIYVNFILMLIYPDGIASNSYYRNINFLDINNGLVQFMLPALFSTVMYSELNYGKLSFRPKILIAVSMVTMIISWSATGLIGFFILLIFLIFFYGKKQQSFFRPTVTYSVSALLYLLIIIIRAQDIFSYIIEILMHKNLSFTGRTEIWDYAMSLIRSSFLTGYGYYYGNGIVVRNNNLYSTHNGVLEVMVRGGFIALVFFLIIYVIAGIKLNKNGHKTACLISAALFAFMTMMLAETHIGTFFVPALAVMGYHSEALSKAADNVPEKGAPLSLRYRYLRYRGGVR